MYYGDVMKNQNIWKVLMKDIKQRLDGRKLVLRWKNNEFEELLFYETRLKADFYVTRNPHFVDNVETFSDEILRNKSNEYLLVILSALKWNKSDADRYKAMGYVEGKDILWCSSKPEIIRFENSSIASVYEDASRNYLSSKSKVNIELCGTNNYVEIGENVDFSNMNLKIHNGVHLIFKDNANCYWSSLELKDGDTLIVYE